MHPCIKAGSWLKPKECQKSVCSCVCGALEMTLAGYVKVCLTGGATESALFFPPSSPPAVQSIQLLSPQGSRQSIKASGCILLTCAAPLMNSQHDPGWQAGNGCNKDCFCMLFASLINHLAVQQIREPHGNLISHGKGEEEESSGGKRELLVAGSLYFIPLFSPAERWSKVCGGWMEGLLLFFFLLFFCLGAYLSHQCSVKPGTCLCACKSINNNRRRVQTFT